MLNSLSALVILDGFGYNQDQFCNAVYQAHPHHFNNWLHHYPSALLKASGTYVGLLPDMIGNSEVGHLTIGSGRIIKQPVVILHEMIYSGALFKNPMLIKRFKELKENDGTLHLMGLLSDVGAHSHEYHLLALLDMAVNQGINKIIIHPFLDGRDTPPKAAAIYLERLEKVINHLKVGAIGSLHGRHYAMDRDNNWDLTQISYDTLTQKQEIKFLSWQEALIDSYAHNITDEFFYPKQIHESAYIKAGDGLIFFNFREDRARQLTHAFTEKNFNSFPRTLVPLKWMITATNYNSFPVDVIYHKESVNETFFDVLEKEGKKIFSIAETEKYAHVTYFFNGGKEKVRENEKRVLIPSIKNELTYANNPRMSADAITHAALESLSSDPYDFYLINYANADMVGHSGNFKSTCKAIKCLDEQLEKLYKVIVEELNGTLYITGDHGKAEEMWDKVDNQPRTAHTNNPVYFLMINKQIKGQKFLPLYALSDIAPFILKQLSLLVPKVMK